MRFLRAHYASARLRHRRRACASLRNGRRVSLAGLVLIRQRPGSAKGVCFITLEDETGIANLVVWPDAFEAQRKVVMGARLMVVHGMVQQDEEVIHVIARSLEDDTAMLRAISGGSDALDAEPGRWRRELARPPARPSARRRGHPQEPGFSLSTLALQSAAS